jgi:hypothetical protein
MPGQRMLSLNPKMEKLGEEGHRWYWAFKESSGWLCQSFCFRTESNSFLVSAESSTHLIHVLTWMITLLHVYDDSHLSRTTRATRKGELQQILRPLQFRLSCSLITLYIMGLEEHKLARSNCLQLSRRWADPREWCSGWKGFEVVHNQTQ